MNTIELPFTKADHTLWNFICFFQPGVEKNQLIPLITVSVDWVIQSAELLYSEIGSFPHHQNTIITAASYSQMH